MTNRRQWRNLLAHMRCDYNKALVQLAFGEGSTLEKNNLTVDIK